MSDRKVRFGLTSAVVAKYLNCYSVWVEIYKLKFWLAI